jgi:hypothetical protein
MSRNTSRQVLAALRGGANAYDHANEAVLVNQPAVSSPATMGKSGLNPPFVAQIQLQVIKRYYTENAGVYAAVLPAALPVALQLQLPAFMFANLDFASGYAKARAQYPLQGWAYNRPVVYQKDVASDIFAAWTATVTNQLVAGDVVLPYTAVDGGTNYLAIVILRTTNVPMAALIEATNSNSFGINLIRYKVVLGQEAQLQNQILASKMSMFGKFTSDPLNPEAFQSPMDQQPNIVDVDAETEVNKYKGLAVFTNYDVLSLTWNIFIAYVVKTNDGDAV